MAGSDHLAVLLRLKRTSTTVYFNESTEFSDPPKPWLL
jgi:hypothetical protein